MLVLIKTVLCGAGGVVSSVCGILHGASLVHTVTQTYSLYSLLMQQSDLASFMPLAVRFSLTKTKMVKNEKITNSLTKTKTKTKK